MALTLRTAPQASAVRPSSARRSTKVVCQAQQNDVAKGLVAAAAAVAIGFGNVDAAKADIAGLVPCSESKAYAKIQKKELKYLERRLKQYEADSAPAIALKATIERTNKRFANYAKAGLLCGPEGLPHLISDPGLALRFGHAGEVFIPTILFLYIAGYIGYAGRQYLNATRNINKEIIIDVPLALKFVGQGAGWPVAAFQELRNGTLLEKEENITVSPR